MNKRQKIVQEAFIGNEEAVIKRLKQVYSVSLDSINEKTKALQAEILNIQAQLDKVEDEDKRAVLKSMEQSKIYQKQYQDALKKQVSSILDNMQVEEFKTVSDYLNKCYEEGFVGTLYDLQGQGIPMAFPLDQEAMVRAVQTDSKISQGLYTRLGEDVSVLKKKITAQVSRGIATGMSYAQVAQQLAGDTKIGFNNAVRIARTEGHRIQVQSTMDACYKAKDRGADVVKQWDAALDARTRDSHAKVDGEIKELDEKFSNGLMQPGDPSGSAAEVVNCRCALLQRARWAVEGGFTKMNNFTKQLETFESPEDYAEFKKGFFSKENKQYMNYVQQMEDKYKTKDFATILSKMDDREYKHYSKLLANNPMYNKKAANNVLTNTDIYGKMSSVREFSEQSEKSFIENVKGQYKMEDIKNELSSALKSGRPNAVSAFKKHVEKDSVATWDSADGNYHQGGKVYLNALDSINDPRGISTAYFHEFGHLIDKKASGTNSKLSMSSSVFGEAIRNDVKDYINKFQEENGTFGAYRKLSEELGANMSIEEAAKFHAVSDIFDGVTKGQISGRYGHSGKPGYWQQDGALESETFAHMFQAQFNDEEYALLEKYFPNALKEFETLIERAAK